MMFIEIALLVSAGNWPQYGQNSSNTHLQTTTGAMSEAPVVKWSYRTGNWVESFNPALGEVVSYNPGPEVVVGSQTDTLYCFSGYNGSLLWKYGAGADIYSAPCISDLDRDGNPEVLFGTCGAGGGSLFCLNGGTGTLKWKYTPPSPSTTYSPKTFDLDGDGLDEVLFMDDWYIYCLQHDGTPWWNHLNAGGVSTPAIADINRDGQPEIAVGAGNVLWFYRRNGVVFRQIILPAGVDTSSPAVADVNNDGKTDVLIGCLDGHLYCYDSLGTQVWKYPTIGAVGLVKSGVAVGDMDGNGSLEVVFGSEDGKVYCLKGSDGSLIWNYSIGSGVHRTPALADVDGDGWLEVVAPNRGGGLLYCLNTDGSLLWTKALAEDLHDPTIADVDDDNCIEIMLGTHTNVTADFWVLDDPMNATGCGAVGNEETDGASDIDFRPLGKGIYLFLPKQAQVSLSLYDASGRLVQNLYSGNLEAGSHTFVSNVAAGGVYLAVLRYRGETRSTLIVR